MKKKVRKPKGLKFLEYFKEGKDLKIILHEEYFYLQPNNESEYWWIGNKIKAKKLLTWLTKAVKYLEQEK